MKIIEVKCCVECPYRWAYIGGEHYCNYERISYEMKSIGDINDIPLWCPLPDVSDRFSLIEYVK
jgi:hypothetical protein